jgi:mannose-1-phosphate guanylyltransferase
MKDNYIAIMAGGVGARFWPASRERLPKQFLDIMGIGKSLLRLTYERSLKIVPNENILIVTNEQYKSLVVEHLPELPQENILCEPSRNNTAPCIAYTALRVESMSSDGVMIVLPSDHVILKEDIFVEKINTAVDFARTNDALLTLGIQPTRPDTGYGYIEMDNEAVQGDVIKVKSFREKPDKPTAEKYLSSGGYVWNAGIFIWSIRSILSSFQNNAPGILDILSSRKEVFGTSSEQPFINEWYPQTESISVDYAIMERSENVYTIPSDIGWSDLGTWASLHDMLDKNEKGTALLGEGMAMSTSNSLIKTYNGKLVVAEGLDDFIVIDEKDVLLIWPKDREQEIKSLRSTIAEKFKGKYS